MKKRKINIRQILEGWGNEVLDTFDALDPEIKQLSEDRLEICMSCPLRTHSTCDVNKSIIIDNVEYYGCGCYLPAKSKCVDCECPANKWEENESKD